ncbi:LLM class F420-dependent oxidoreductase [Mycolicibacterium sp. 018/SC-01/001]|uniref:LLM class F420-dependent oxidoreductase n=1 Tax=Mycolicibacterium sp. 018/SC-01/001 TaxID=2592069 RepID=UPI00118173AD|nr:LLM class F420-dependent oxidoreductase [Mycolicibacterium sp. 018/SC-01/001]TRW88791.1 LLM class F420-dependent oxidoreductase [Mycolicibacterium sp. 018/SC-01/001]
MKLAVHYIDFLPGSAETLAPTLAATARAAEEVGAEMFTLADHFFQMENVGRAEDPFLEGYTSLGYLAGVTERITLAMLVTGVTYRRPGLLAKTMTTLDVLAGGRTMFGIGAAWYEREHLALGVPYPPTARRFEMLEETLQICLQMWSDDDGPYHGEHFELAETLCRPQPIRRPPVLIGGGGEKKTLRLVAQYAEVWNNTAPLEEIPHKLDVLRRHCDDVGRDFREIRLSAGLFDDPFTDVDGYLRTLDRYSALGFDLISTGPVPGTPDPQGWVRRLGDEIIPRLSA